MLFSAHLINNMFRAYSCLHHIVGWLCINHWSMLCCIMTSQNNKHMSYIGNILETGKRFESIRSKYEFFLMFNDITEHRCLFWILTWSLCLAFHKRVSWGPQSRIVYLLWYLAHTFDPLRSMSLPECVITLKLCVYFMSEMSTWWR